MATAKFYDGNQAIGHVVTVTITPTVLLIRSIEQDEIYDKPLFRHAWHYADLFIAGNPKDGVPVRLSHKRHCTARLLIEDPAQWKEIYNHLKNKRNHGFHIPVNAGVIMGAFVLSLLVLMGMYFSVPHLSSWVVPAVPQSSKIYVSDLVMTELFKTNTYCTSPEGDAALAALQQRLISSGFIDYNQSFRVVKHKDTNAISLPDNRIILFSGLLDAAETPDEVAGVLAHELGHIMHNHPTKSMVHALGGQMIFWLMFGDSGNWIDGQTLLKVFVQSSHQRVMEREADDAASQILQAAQLDSQGLLLFFERIRAKEHDALKMLTYLSSHPSTDERIERVKALPKTSGSGNSPAALPPEQWQALKAICN